MSLGRLCCRRQQIVSYFHDECAVICDKSCDICSSGVLEHLADHGDDAIHPMQIWRTTPSSPGTSCMKARLIGPRCFVLTSFLRKVLLQFVRDLDWFISLCLRVCHQKGVKSSTGKKVFLVYLFASEEKTDEGKEFDPIHDRVNGKSLFATFQARRS